MDDLLRGITAVMAREVMSMFTLTSQGLVCPCGEVVSPVGISYDSAGKKAFDHVISGECEGNHHDPKAMELHRNRKNA